MRFSMPRWGWAQFRADAWVSLALAVLIAVVSFTATALPRLVTTMASDQAAYQINDLSTLQRNLRAVINTNLPPNLAEPGQGGVPEVDVESLDGPPEYWADAYESIEAVRAAQPEPLRSTLGPGQIVVQRASESTDAPPGTDIAFLGTTVAVDPVIQDHTRLVEGSWPAVPQPVEVDRFDPNAERLDPPVPVVALVDAAERVGWQVGETYNGLELVGLIEPLDPEDERWEYVVGGTGAGLIEDPNAGTTATMTAYQNPASLPRVYLTPTSAEAVLWFPLDASAVPGDQLGDLWAQSRSLAGERYPVVIDRDAAGPPDSANYVTQLDATLEALLLQLAASYAVLAIVVAGPAGVVLAVLALGARLIVSRRSAGLALAHARGASPRQLRVLGGIEGAATGVVGAVVGFTVAAVAVEGTLTPLQVVIALGIGLLPGILLALVTAPTSLRGERSDLSRRSTSRVRWLVELIVVAGAAAATWLLVVRGVQTTSADDADATLQVPTVDPLVAATPMLLTAASCVLALRLFPLPVLAVQRRLRAGRRLTGFLGAARAVRDSAAGLIPGLALVVGVSVAVFSSIMVSTVMQGAESAAYEEAGADLRLNGPIVTDEGVADLRAIPGVEQVATLRDIPSDIPVGPFERGTRLPGYAVEVEELRALQDGRPGLEPLPAALLDTSSGRLPAVAGGSLTPTETPAAGRFAAVDVEWVGSIGTLGGVTTRGGFVIVDRALAAEALGEESSARAALLGLAPDADADAVIASVEERFPTGVVSSPPGELEDFTSSPLVVAMVIAFGAAVGVSLALCIVAVVLTQLTASRARAQLLAVLRTLGLDRRQARGLTAWEVLPLLATSFVVGAVLGLAVPWVLLATVDLTGLTGGVAQPDLAVSWPLLLGVLGAVLLFVGLAVAFTSSLASRANIARQLRIGESR